MDKEALEDMSETQLQTILDGLERNGPLAGGREVQDTKIRAELESLKERGHRSAMTTG